MLRAVVSRAVGELYEGSKLIPKLIPRYRYPASSGIGTSVSTLGIQLLQVSVDLSKPIEVCFTYQ